MQPLPVVLTAALWLAGISNVFAASSVDLRVAGAITPAACTPTLSGGGMVDHGKISVQDLNPLGFTQLPDATLTLEVSCNAPALIAVKATDNRAGTADPSYSQHPEISVFGLGLASNGKAIGRYSLKTSNATADDVVRGMIESPTGQSWVEAWESIWQPNWMRAVNDATGTGLAPLPLQNLKVDLVISTRLVSKSALPSAEEIQIDGSATLDVVYL